MNRDTYAVHKSKSISDKAVVYGRAKIYDFLCSAVPLESLESILDVGVTADREQESSNFFEQRFPHPSRVTALSQQDASWMEQEYEGLTFVEGDGRNMPFEDNAFDLVFSSAVIEHVGNRESQKQFLVECARVSRKYVFLTTPNRWHPVEFHTVLPLLHWLPPKVHRSILRGIGKQFFSYEENLNLLTKKELLGMSLEENLGAKKVFVKTTSFLGFPSNLLLVIEK